MCRLKFQGRYLFTAVIVVAWAALPIYCGNDDFNNKKARVARSTSAKPEIIERPQRQRVHVNQTAIFVCRVKSSTPVKIKWQKNDKELAAIPGYSLLVNDSLTFLHVQKSDGGIYKCVASNDAGTTSSEASLTVLDPLVAPTITQISPNQTIQEGTRVTFNCEARGNPLPEINWKISLENPARPDTDTQPERPSPGSIRILSATPRDSGQYACIAENKKGKDTRVLYLQVLGYPVFLESPPSNKTVHENVTVSLNCKVVGLPTPEVRWYYGNKQVGLGGKVIVLSNKTLVIKSVNFEDRGIYTCVANNSAKLRSSKSTDLRVLRTPSLSCCPNQINVTKNQTAIHGKPAFLDCSAVGYPEPQYNWEFNNATVSQSSIFTIPRVTLDDAGVYSCTVRNNLGSLLVRIFLSVSVPPEVSVRPERTIAVRGDNVKFTCTATGDPTPEIKWYSSQGLISRNSSLVIVNVSVNNHGQYQCEGKSAAGQNIAKALLIVAVPPTFNVLPQRNITANESSSIIVKCSAIGPDKPVINWYRLTVDGKKINTSVNDRISSKSGELKISRLKRSDGGFYSCEAMNQAGVTNTTFFINIQYQPYLIVSKKNVSIVAGRRALLHCPVEANPAPKIRWIHPVNFDGPNLSIVNVEISHEGRYICTGANALGTLQATLEVTVMTRPRIVGLRRINRLNNWISLTCVTEGNPKSAVQWLDQIPLPRGSYSIHRGNLQIETRFVDKLSFICNASNSYGWMLKYVRVPSSPSGLNAVEITSSSVKLSWVVNKSEIISHYIVERLSKAYSTSIVVNSSSSSFSDRGLQPFNWYLYRVKAANVLGTSGPSGSLNVTALEGVPSQPTEVIAISRTLTTVSVVWKPPQEPRGLLSTILYEVYYLEHGSSSNKDMKINTNTSADRPLEISSLKSNTLYIIKIRAGRKGVDGSIYWSDFEYLRIKTLQKAPTFYPEIEKFTSNGPRRIFVSWKTPAEYVEGYKLRYDEYESSNNATIIEIRSWNKTAFVITGLIPNRYYEIQIRMFTSGGDGPWSAPVVVLTDKDRLSSFSSSDGLPWKIALGGSILALIILSLLLTYVYFSKKSKQNIGSDNHGQGSDKKRKRKKSRNKDRYDFDNVSHVSNESEGTIHGTYNINMENDIDLSMFEDSHHTDLTGAVPTMYVENPILPSNELEGEDSYEPVRLATFTARPSPMPTPGGSPDTSHHQLPASEMSSHSPDFPEPPLYSKVDFAAKARNRRSSPKFSEQVTDDILI